MRTIALAFLLIAGIGFLGFSGPESTSIPSDEIEMSHIKIRLKNNCTREVKYRYNGLSSSLSKNYYRDITIKPGYTLEVDGKDFADITASDDGKEFIICK